MLAAKMEEPPRNTGDSSPVPKVHNLAGAALWELCAPAHWFDLKANFSWSKFGSHKELGLLCPNQRSSVCFLLQSGRRHGLLQFHVFVATGWSLPWVTMDSRWTVVLCPGVFSSHLYLEVLWNSQPTPSVSSASSWAGSGHMCLVWQSEGWPVLRWCSSTNSLKVHHHPFIGSVTVGLQICAGSIHDTIEDWKCFSDRS